MKTIPVERRASITRDEYVEQFLSGHGKPLVLTEATRPWPAREKWTFDTFEAQYGGDPGIFCLGFLGKFPKSVTNLGAFIRNLDQPYSQIEGFWVDSDGKPLATMPEHEGIFAFAWDSFKLHPEMYDDIAPFPSCIPNIVPYLTPEVLDLVQRILNLKLHSIYVSRKDTIAPLHKDFGGSNGSLAQFCGRKLAYLFSPEFDAQLYDGRIDPENPDFDRFPLLEQVTAWSCILEPGDYLLMPPDCWHYTRSLDHSITLSHNFFSEFNISRYLPYLLSQVLVHAGEAESRAQLIKRVSRLLPAGPASLGSEPIDPV